MPLLVPVMLVLVLVLKDSLRTKMQSLSLLLKSLFKDQDKDLSSKDCIVKDQDKDCILVILCHVLSRCVQFYLKVNLLKRHVHGAS